jgi:hypothetical protein
MDDYPTPKVYYVFAAWRAVSFFALLLGSIWLFRRAPRAAGWLMLVGSALKSCDAFAQEFVFSQLVGLWAIKSQIQSYEDSQTLRLQQQISEWVGLGGLVGLTLFGAGLVMFARHLLSADHKKEDDAAHVFSNDQ